MIVSPAVDHHTLQVPVENGTISFVFFFSRLFVLKNVQTEKTLLNEIKARKLRFFCQTKHQDSIVKNIPEGKVGGTPRPSGSVFRQHQGVVRAQLSRVYQTSQSALDF